MYKIILHGVENRYGYAELVKIFINPKDFIMVYDDDDKEDTCDEIPDKVIELTYPCGSDKNELKRMLYRELSSLTGMKHEWGILTGVRPVKFAGKLIRQLGREGAKKRLTDFFFLSDEKADLILDIYEYQNKLLPEPPENSVGLYIGIPFCPTRCLYCSFASNKAVPEEIERYLVALHKEIDAVADMMNEKGIYPETIYIGGGTPTTLTAAQLDSLMEHVNRVFDLSRLREYTVESGRPDTIDMEKLKVIKNRGADRISINPQTMKNETLEIVGRSHKAEEIVTSFAQAHEAGIESVNADLIAGLQGEDEKDFSDTMHKLIALGPQNITVHTLAVKRASRLVEIDRDFHYKQAAVVRKQLAAGRKILKENGYVPFYLYRQKNMAGGLENTGYCRNDTISTYNVRIMEEKQTIVALGAGGISKAYYKEEDRLERVPNVTNYQIYIDRIDEMIQRKKDNLFQEEEK